MSIVSSELNSRLHINRYLWVFQLLSFVIFWGGLLWLWNLWRPLYLTLGTFGVSVGNAFYHVNKIESILFLQRTRGVTIMPKRKKSSPIFITLWKTQQGSVYIAIKQWADVHGIRVITK